MTALQTGQCHAALCGQRQQPLAGRFWGSRHHAGDEVLALGAEGGPVRKGHLGQGGLHTGLRMAVVQRLVKSQPEFGVALAAQLFGECEVSPAVGKGGAQAGGSPVADNSICQQALLQHQRGTAGGGAAQPLGAGGVQETEVIKQLGVAGGGLQGGLQVIAGFAPQRGAKDRAAAIAPGVDQPAGLQGAGI